MGETTPDDAALSRALQFAFALLFLVGIGAPPVVTVLRSGDEAAAAAERENRRAAPFPERPQTATELAEWPGRFDDWYRDGFGLRTALVTLHSLVKVFGLGLSPSPTLLMGKDHWIFATTYGAIDGARGVALLDERELNDWRKGLEARQQFLDARGIRYLYVLVPHKANVYPDQLPDRLAPVGPSRLDRFVAYMRENSTVEIVDLRPAFAAARADDAPDRHLYSPLGVHWSMSGAWVGAGVILDALGGIALEDGRWRAGDMCAVGRVDSSDSWAGRIYLKDHLEQRRTRLTLTRERLSTKHVRADTGKPRDATFTRADGRGVHCVVLHDSFGTQLLPFLADSFRKLDGWRWSGFKTADIERLRPDVVIQVYSELTLVTQRPDMDADLGRDVLLEEFRRSPDRLLSVTLAQDLTPHSMSPEVGVVDGAQGVEITVEGQNALLVLPALPARVESQRRALGLVITAPKACRLAIFYRLPGMDEIDQRSTLLFSLEAGLNELAIAVPDVDLAGPLVLGLGRAEQPYILRSLEVRALPR